jgi:Kelch motif
VHPRRPERWRAWRAWAGPPILAGLFGAGCFGITTDSPAPLDVAAPGTWATRATMPSERQEVAVAVLDGRMYVIGGFGEGASPVATVEAYDPATDRWEARASLPEATHHPAAAVVGGRLFVVGGYTGGRMSWTPTAGLYEYDGAGNAWIARAPMPTPRGALAAVALGGRLHAIGGGADGVLSAQEIYDPARDAWTTARPMSVARDHLTGAAVQGQVWAIGGRRSFFGDQYDAVEIYDAGADVWRLGVPLPQGRGGLTAAVAGDRLFVFGGESPLRIFSAVDMFDRASGKWIGKAPMPTPRHGIGAAVIDGHVYIAGGGTRPGYATTNVNERYTP